MATTKHETVGLYEQLVASARRLRGEAEYLEAHLVEALNSAYVQGATDARKAITGHDPKVEGGEDE